MRVRIRLELLKYIRPIILLVIFLFPVIYAGINGRAIEEVAVIVAFLIGLGAIYQQVINRYFFPPLFKFEIREIGTKTIKKENQKYYNLSIKNYGWSSAKNVRVKIKDGENKSWIHLRRPFTSLMKPNEKDTVIKNLSVNEEDDFNIGHIDAENCFTLATDIFPNNQVVQIHAVNGWTYYFEIIADNSYPFRFKLRIQNNGYMNFNISNIQLI